MPKVILTSTHALYDAASGALHPGIADAVASLRASGNGVFVVSNQGKPPWVDTLLPNINYQRYPKRQGGGVIRDLLKANKERYPDLAAADFVILSACNTDMQMAAQERALQLRATWISDGNRWEKYGIPVRDPAELLSMVGLLDTKEPWYFAGRAPRGGYDIFALTNAGTYNESTDHERLANQLRGYLKEKDKVFRGVQLHLLSSVYVTETLTKAYCWGFYPSSSPKRDDQELMGKITRLVREPLVRRFAKQGEPLFVRHQKTPPRHKVGGDRTDPTSQLLTLHLNPAAKKRIKDRDVIVTDDYLTYGASFGVSAALLRAGGAASVTCVAMGKFGRRARDYEIEITGDPFAPLGRDEFRGGNAGSLDGTHTREAQFELIEKFRGSLLW